MATNSDRYTSVAIVLHWLIAAGVLVLVAIGLTMAHGTITAATKFKLFQLHKSVGITVTWPNFGSDHLETWTSSPGAP